MNFDEYMAQEGTAELEDISSVIEKFNAQQPDEPENPAPTPAAPATPEPTPTPATPEAPKPNETPKPDPQNDDVATNAANAERRRAREAKIAQAALESAPEVKLAKQLAELSGRTVEQMLEDIRSNQIADQLKQEGYTDEQIPALVPRVVKAQNEQTNAQQQAAQAQEQLTQMQFDAWTARIEIDGQAIIGEHPYLTKADVDQARDYMLTTLSNPHVPLRDAVYALHGEKIIAAQAEKIKIDHLAEISGRKPSPLPPQGANAPSGDVLTPDEKFICRQMKISEADYIKYKSTYK